MIVIEEKTRIAKSPVLAVTVRPSSAITEKMPGANSPNGDTRRISTRIRMMDLSAQVLQGLFDPGTAYVDHAITEVFLAGRWIKVDS